MPKQICKSVCCSDPWEQESAPSIFCFKVGDFSMGVYKDLLSFGGSLKRPVVELRFYIFHFSALEVAAGIKNTKIKYTSTTQG